MSRQQFEDWLADRRELDKEFRGLRRSKPMKRSAMKKRNPKRRARLFAEDFHSKEFVEWIHGFPCARCEVYGYTVAAHTKSRGAGGKACDIIPLCANRHGIEGCHSLYDRSAKEIANDKLRLRGLAAHYWQAWLNREEEVA